jgi:hypothetical protein
MTKRIIAAKEERGWAAWRRNRVAKHYCSTFTYRHKVVLLIPKVVADLSK